MWGPLADNAILVSVDRERFGKLELFSLSLKSFRKLLGENLVCKNVNLDQVQNTHNFRIPESELFFLQTSSMVYHSSGNGPVGNNHQTLPIKVCKILNYLEREHLLQFQV